ncbi:MAG: hypothetical protein IKZ19_07210, partial [Clostridia bacterium]|nr:hypothetical protein [Clostridia bacterium]
RFAVFADAENTGPLLSLGAEIIYIDPPQKPEYPWDAALNVLPLGNILLLNPKSASSRVADQFSQLERVEVKQGYCACSVSVLTEDRIITGDAGIAKALKGRGVSVISADNSKLFLDGYGCGFIGGCSGLIGNRRICFTGDVSEALDLGCLIQSGFEVVFLTKEKPFDCGGIVPVAAVSE